jgi:hypothetical protein
LHEQIASPERVFRIVPATNPEHSGTRVARANAANSRPVLPDEAGPAISLRVPRGRSIWGIPEATKAGASFSRIAKLVWNLSESAASI